MDFGPSEAYEEIERGDFVELRFSDGGHEDVLVQGVMWLSGHHRPLQIVSSRGRRYALGEGDRVARLDRGRGF